METPIDDGQVQRMLRLWARLTESDSGYEKLKEIPLRDLAEATAAMLRGPREFTHHDVIPTDVVAVEDDNGVWWFLHDGVGKAQVPVDQLTAVVGVVREVTPAPDAPEGEPDREAVQARIDLVVEALTQAQATLRAIHDRGTGYLAGEYVSRAGVHATLCQQALGDLAGQGES